MRYFRTLYLGFVLGLTAALLARQSTWLEMRVKTGLLIPIVLLLVVSLFFIGQYFKIELLQFRTKITVGLTLISGLLLFLLYGVDRLQIVPAATIREAFNRSDWTFQSVNLVLVTFLGMGLLLILSAAYFYPEKSTPETAKKTTWQFKKMSTQKKRQIGYTLLGLAVLFLLYLFVTPVRNTLNQIVTLLATLDISGLRDYIQSFGFWGPLVSILLMMFQSIAAPLPAFVITFANAYIYGWFWGMIISWSGAMFGAALCFYIAKLLGRPVAEKFVSARALNKMDDFFEAYGQYTIVILRLIPFVSFDVVSYAAGLTGLTLGHFLLATGIGQLPATIVYSVVGGNLEGNNQALFLGLLGFCLLIVLSLVLKKVLLRQKEMKETEK